MTDNKSWIVKPIKGKKDPVVYIIKEYRPEEHDGKHYRWFSKLEFAREYADSMNAALKKSDDKPPMTDKQMLKPCPFCRGEARKGEIYIEGTAEPQTAYGCFDKCGVYMLTPEAWNTRPAPVSDETAN